MKGPDIGCLRFAERAQAEHGYERLMQVDDVEVLPVQNPPDLVGQPGRQRDAGGGSPVGYWKRSADGFDFFLEIAGAFLADRRDDFYFLAELAEVMGQI